MDEPCSALDPISTLAIEDLIGELKSQLHDRDRDPQHAAGRPGVGPDRLLQPGRRRPAGRLIEIDDTQRSSPTRARRPPRTTSPAASAEIPARAQRSGAAYPNDGGVAADVLAGDQEDDPAGNRHGVVGEALVEPPEQRDDRPRLDSVRPVGRHQGREHLLVQVVHQVVFGLQSPLARSTSRSHRTRPA